MPCIYYFCSHGYELMFYFDKHIRDWESELSLCLMLFFYLRKENTQKKTAFMSEQIRNEVWL